MIRKLEEQRSYTRNPGVEMRVLMEPAEMYEAGRLYACITVAPGASLSYHEHKGELESFYIVKGTCRVEDNHETAYLKEGDVMITPHDHGHAVYNDSAEPVDLIALIVSREQGVPGGSKSCSIH